MVADELRVTDRLSIPDHELAERFGPSGGPGGQHANTANTAATVTFDIANSGVLTDHQRQRLRSAYGHELSVTASDERSQYRNRQLARQRLAERLRAALRTQRSRRKTKPTRGSVERRIGSKKRRSKIKKDRQGRWE